MLHHHLTTALRSLRRRRGFAVLHVSGLAVGLACCFLAALYARHELTFDRFHERADRIFRLSQEIELGDETLRLLSTSPDAAERLAAEAPGLEAVVLIEEGAGLLRRPTSEEAVREDRLLYASEPFFEVFSFPLLRGDARRALAAPNAVVLSQSAAQRHFGDADPVGQTLLLERTSIDALDRAPIELTVRGVAADPPSNSTIQYDFVVAGSTMGEGPEGRAPLLAEGGTAYVLMQRAEDHAALARAAQALLVQEEQGFGPPSRALVERLASLHVVESGAGRGVREAVVLFGAVALLVLLVAVINYVSLATVRAASRAQEVGVRKALGAHRGHLAGQFLTEALLLASAAGVGAVGLTTASLSTVNSTFGTSLSLGANDLPLVLALAGLTLVVGLAAGAYPAAHLARLHPAHALKGTGVPRHGGSWLQQGLVVVQFGVTVALLAATAVVQAQLRYAQTRDLGLDGSQVLTLDLSAPSLARQGGSLRQAVAAVPGVRRVSLSSGVPGQRYGTMMPMAGPAAGAPTLPTSFALADPAFAATYGLRLAAGRFFASGQAGGVVLNETAARELGLMTTNPTEAIGQRVITGDAAGAAEVTGVLRDFHFGSLHHAIGPYALLPMEEGAGGLALSVQLEGADVPATLAGVERAWQRLVPEYPFDYRFVDDAYDAFYRAEQRTAAVFGVLAAVAMGLACLGLLGLAAYAAARRTKEVGVRKVLGASAASIVGLLSKDFARLVAVAVVVAVPVAYYAMGRWLDGFAYRVELGPTPFVLASAGALAVALTTVGLQALRAAVADPVKALRYE